MVILWFSTTNYTSIRLTQSKNDNSLVAAPKPNGADVAGVTPAVVTVTKSHHSLPQRSSTPRHTTHKQWLIPLFGLVFRWILNSNRDHRLAKKWSRFFVWSQWLAERLAETELWTEWSLNPKLINSPLIG